MTQTIEREKAPRSAGPFITESGRRLPVRVLAEKDTRALVEFHDYLSRRSETLQLAGMPDASRESVTEALTDGPESDSRPILAIMAGPAVLIRGIGQYHGTSATVADATFTIDASLEADHVGIEMLYRLADHARQAGFTRIETVARPGSALLDAIQHSGFTFEREPDTDRYALEIAEQR